MLAPFTPPVPSRKGGKLRISPPYLVLAISKKKEIRFVNFKEWTRSRIKKLFFFPLLFPFPLRRGVYAFMPLRVGTTTTTTISTAVSIQAASSVFPPSSEWKEDEMDDLENSKCTF